MTVNRIRPPENGNGVRRGACACRVVVGVGEGQPIVDAGVLVTAREAAATVQYRTQTELGNLRRRRIGDLRLNHLADLLLHRETTQILVDGEPDPSFRGVRGTELLGARLPPRRCFTHGV